MKQSILLSVLLIAASLMIVPMVTISETDAADSDVAVTGEEFDAGAADLVFNNPVLGWSLLIAFVAFFLFIIYLEYRGVLKDPLLDTYYY